MPKTPPALTDEESALRYIELVIKNYEPGFELGGSFTPGVVGCSDPKYLAVRNKWLDDLDRKGISSASYWVSKGVAKAVAYSMRADAERRSQNGKPADSRLNWRVTVHHGDNVFHIMAIDKSFERYALELQTEPNFKGDRTLDEARPNCLRYDIVNHLSELKPILDSLYQGFKGKEEESRQQESIDKAVAKEREKGIARGRIGWWTLIILIVIVGIMALLTLYVAIA